MLFSKLSVVGFATAALALTINKRDFNTVNTDLQTLNKDANNLKNAANSYDGSLGQGFALNNVGQQFDTDMKQSANDCNAAAAFTTTQCTTATNYLTNTFEPSLKAALAALKSKRQTFTNAGLKSNLQSSLKQFKTECDDVINCIKTKCPKASQTAAQTPITKIDADFTDAINYFS